MLGTHLGFNDFDGCAMLCAGDQMCLYFAYDSNDGECFSSRMPASADDACFEAWKSSDNFDMYKVSGDIDVALPEPEPEVPAEPEMVAERQRCKADHSRFGFYRNDFEQCAEQCQDHDTCEFVHFDPNDGECLRVDTADRTCPEGFQSSNWYDFWYIPARA